MPALAVKKVLDKAGHSTTARPPGKPACTFMCRWEVVAITTKHVSLPRSSRACLIGNCRRSRAWRETQPSGKRRFIWTFLQNRRGQTLAAPYSVRPHPGATVSTPLRWEEVKPGLDPSQFTIRTIGKRLEKTGDLWTPVLSGTIDLVKCLQRLG